MEKAVEEIIEFFAEKEPTLSNLGRFFWDNRLEAIAFICGGLSLGLALVLPLFELEQKSIFFLYICFFVSLIVYVLSSMVSSLKFVVGAQKETLVNIQKRFVISYQNAESLSKYDVDALNQVKRLFKGRIEFLRTRIGFLVGAIDKLGLIPALIALYISYSNYIVDNSEAVEWSPYILGFVGGIYLGALCARAITDSLHDKISVIELSLKMKEQRREFRLV